MTSFRLSSGGRIDRSRPLGFTFDGVPMQAYAGDTLASALLANGRSLVGRSFKYHRPRGIVTAGAAEPNALVTLGRGGRTEPNTRATLAEVFDGLEAVSQNRWPSLAFDIGAVNGLLSPFLAAGFYYKTFMWPASFWERVYEPLIRRAAGLGRAAYEADPDRYEKSWAHCDLLIIGAGPAGLAAAVTAGRAGADVIVADEGSEAGGSLLSETGMAGGKPAAELLSALLAELASLPNVRLMPRTTVFGWYDDNHFGAVERVQKHVALPDENRPVERLWRIIARHGLLASGAEERPLVFGGNDVPGVMMAHAVRTYLNRYAVAPGKKVAIFTNGASGYHAAADLEARGVEVAAIIDPNTDTPPWHGHAQVWSNAVVRDTVGSKHVSGLEIASAGSTQTIAVDALAMSGGWSPVIHLACHRGAKPVWSDRLAAFLAPQVQQGLTIAGAAAGVQSTDACLADASSKAARICSELGLPAAAPAFALPGDAPRTFQPLWFVNGAKKKAFVDFQNDVQTEDLGLATREGYGHVELAKRYTTTGMATDQGKLSNINAIGILSALRGFSPAQIGTTTFRPFYTPVSFGALTGAASGARFQPVRKSPLHDWARKHGAEFVETGLWHRAAYFPRSGETSWRESVDREVLTVRTDAGLCDVSTLGKIEVRGRDAAEFLDRVYCNSFLKLPVGRARYGLMLREDGFIFDDGTTSRLGEDHFLTTTTTAMAAAVLSHLEFCAQVLWPSLDVRLASVTDQWAQLAIAGPKSRTILQAIVDDDLSNAAFPFLSARAVSLLKGRLSGRLFRISYSGELAYELAVPAGYGEAVADALLAAGSGFGLCAYGTEALGVLRIEKGHVTHAEINGTVIPADLGFGRMVSNTKPDFIGKAMLDRDGLKAEDRAGLVGVRTLDPGATFRTGAHIVPAGAVASLDNDLGYVTSSCFSPNAGRTIGLALVKGGERRIGGHVTICNPLRGEATAGELCAPVFVDPSNERLHG